MLLVSLATIIIGEVLTLLALCALVKMSQGFGSDGSDVSGANYHAFVEFF